jgi:phospholipid/cholesterol/gamma-HCH transport system ATP-binding protein
MNNLVEIHDLHFHYNSNKAVFKGVNIEIPQGKVTTIMGPSGTGKTTLLRLIGGQNKPNQGRIMVAGQEVNSLSRHELYALRKKMMGLLFQNSGLFTHLTVFENVAFPLREHTRLPESMIRSLVLLKLQMVGLRGARNLMPSELSGGMARRVALARAIALDPKLIMYDEPLSGQDPITKGVLVKLIRTLNDALGLTSIIVSHDVQETLSISDYVYVLSEGRIIGQGTPAAIAKDLSPQVKQFIEGFPDGPVPFHYAALPLKQDFLGV